MKYRLITVLVAGSLCFGQGGYSVETTDDNRSGQSDDLTQRGIVEEISAEDLEYYGLVEEEKFPIRANLDIDAYYDSNVFLRDEGTAAGIEDDFVWEVRPEIYYQTSEPGTSEHYFRVYYDPDFILFTNLSDENAISQSGGGDYLFQGDRSLFGFSHKTFETDGANADIGARTNRTQHDTNLYGEYQFTDKFTVEAALGQSLAFYQEIRDRHTWTGEVYALYEVLPKVRMGIGTKIGFVDIQAAPNQSYQQALYRVIYEPSEKIQLNASVGAEFRQYQGPLGWEDRVTPAASLGLVWSPFDSSTFTLTGYRNVTASNSIIGANYVATGFDAAWRQRFFQKFYYTLGGGFEHSDYRPTVVGTVNNRRDNYYFVRNSLDYDFVKYASVSIYHKIEQNFTNSPSSFDRQQVGIAVNLSY
ncbi:MAG: hypothetical protein AAF558_05065 [Verrucomicrobiota bacterium]